MDILYLVDRLENLIMGSQRMPLTNRVLIKEQEVLNIIDQMRLSVPDEIKQARRVNQEKERILAQARDEATKIRTAAREEAEHLVDHEQIILLAEERAAQMQREAEERASQIRQGADAFAVETLRTLEEQLSAAETDISHTILSIRKGMESLTQRTSEEAEEEEEQQAEARSPFIAPLAEEEYHDLDDLPPRMEEQPRASNRRNRPRR